MGLVRVVAMILGLILMVAGLGCNKPDSKSGSGTTSSGPGISLPSGFPLPDLDFPTGTIKAKLGDEWKNKGDGYTAVESYPEGDKSAWYIGFNVTMSVDSALDHFESQFTKMGLTTDSKEYLTEKSSIAGNILNSAHLICTKGQTIWAQITYIETKSAEGTESGYVLMCISDDGLIIR